MSYYLAEQRFFNVHLCQSATVERMAQTVPYHAASTVLDLTAPVILLMGHVTKDVKLATSLLYVIKV